MKKRIYIFISTVFFTVNISHASHEYFDTLRARPDVHKAYSFREASQLPGYWVTYDHASDADAHRQDAAKVVIPAFYNRTTLPHALSETDTVIYFDPAKFDTGWQVKPRDGTGRYARINGELMLVIDSDREAGTVTFARGQRGTPAQAHEQGAIVQMNINSLKGQHRVDISKTEDGNTYLFTWDGYWTDSYLKAGFGQHKCFQFTSGKDSIWLEVDTNFKGGAIKDIFNPETDVAAVGMRLYQQPGGDADWTKTDGNQAGPIVTQNTALYPMAGQFIIKPNTWTRFWVQIEQRANDYDYMSFWVADENNDAVKIYDQMPISVRQKGTHPNSMVDFWLEYNTSTDELVRNDYRDLVAYARNFVALKNPSDVQSLLLRPGSVEVPPYVPPTEPPTEEPPVVVPPVEPPIEPPVEEPPVEEPPVMVPPVVVPPVEPPIEEPPVVVPPIVVPEGKTVKIKIVLEVKPTLDSYEVIVPE